MMGCSLLWPEIMLCKMETRDLRAGKNKDGVAKLITREMQSIMGRAKVEWCLFVIVYKNGNINLKIYDQYEYD